MDSDISGSQEYKLFALIVSKWLRKYYIFYGGIKKCVPTQFKRTYKVREINQENTATSATVLLKGNVANVRNFIATNKCISILSNVYQACVLL